ncbi:MAG TPA: DsbA family protein [Chloroflexota bacterium]|nr:DsbA family protein [Chloroflexota bacterium]
MADATAIDFYFDPSCRWAWWTSVWLRRVAKLRPVTVTWKLFSLAVQDSPEDYRQVVRPDHAQHIRNFDLLRVLALARRRGGNAAIERLFAAYGNAIHGAKEDIWDTQVQARCLEIAGQPASLYVAALADPATEADVLAESRAALALGALGTPTLALSGASTSLFGPILGQVPSGDDALRLWDNVRFTLETPYCYELKRNRGATPSGQFNDDEDVAL